MVGDHALDPCALVFGLTSHQVHRILQLVLEDPAEAFGGPRVDRVQRRVQPAADAEHLLEEALEEDCVAGFVSDLGGEEDALVLARGRVKERGQRVGDRLLADEEQGHGVLGDLLDPRR